MDEKKDAEIANILRSLESQIPNWDTSKCPAVTLSTEKAWSSRGLYRPTYELTYETMYRPFFHHYQGSIDFNTVNIHRTVGMYFLVSTGNRGDIE